MMYVDPTSQYKFVAKTTPNVATTEGTSANIASVPVSVSVSTAGNIVPTTAQAPPNTATHFQAPEHAQKQAVLLQNAGSAVQTGQIAPTADQSAQVQQGQAAGTVAAGQGLAYDGKRMRKSVQRRTVDYNSSVIRFLEARKWFKSTRNQHALQPQEIYNVDVVPPCGYIKNPMNSVTTKFVRTSTNKLRCPIFCVVWTPEGRRLVTGASSGEFTLWNGLTFNFETILQAHDRAVRSMVWSHNDSWLLTGDHGGFVKYWQSNMNNVRMYEAHKDPVRGLSFSPSDNKYASCSDDGLVKVWDFYRCTEERELKGHGADVKCVDWHPSKGLLVSGSKDSQQPVKLWDPKSGNSITTLHCHKSTVMTAKWNSNGNWLVTGSRDHLLKLFDIRMMKELQTFRGHKKEATVVAWHPVHETLFASGGSDGSLMFWLTGVDEKAGAMEKAHEGIVWSLSWHPLGHILCSGSNDHTSKFWARNRPGDVMTDKYNLDIQGNQEDGEYSEEGPSQTSVPALAAYDASAVIPGVGLPVTASNVVLPDSKDVDAHLYGEASRDNRKPGVTQPSTTEASLLYPPPLRQTPRSAFENRPANFSQGKAMIPGLDIPSTFNTDIQGQQENEGYKIPRLPPPSAPRLRLPLRVPNSNLNLANRPPPLNRPPLANHPNAGNRPQFAEFGSRPGHGYDFRGLPGQGGQDPVGNFGHSGPFPPNQFMRFPGPRGVMLDGLRVGFGNQRGPGGMQPGPMMAVPRHLGPRSGPPDSSRPLRPNNITPGQYGRRDGLQGGSRPHGTPNDPNIRSEGPHSGPLPRGFPPNQHGPKDGSQGVPHGGPNDQHGLTHGGPRTMDKPSGQHGLRDEPEESSNGAPTGRHGAHHGELRPKDTPLHQHGHRDGPQGGSRDGSTGQQSTTHLGPKPIDISSTQHGPPGGPRVGPTAQHGTQHGRPRPIDIPSGQHGPRDGQQGGANPALTGQQGVPREVPRPNDLSPRQHAPREGLQGPRGGLSEPRNDSNFGPRMMNNNIHSFRPRAPKPPQFQQPRTDQPKAEMKSPEGDKRGVPEAREKFLRRSRDSSPRDSPPVIPSNPVKTERRASDSDAPGILGDYVTHVKEMTRTHVQEMQRGILENIARSAAGLVQQIPDMARPDRAPHSRADMDRPRGPDTGRSPHHKPDVGRAGDRAPHDKSEGERRGDRPPSNERTDAYPGRRPSRDRQDQSRPGDHERNRPPFERREDRPSHDRPDLGRLAERQRDRPLFEGRQGDRPPKYGGREDSRPPFDRQDSGRQSDRSFADTKDLPAHEKPGLLPIPDMFIARAPRPHDGPPRNPPSANHRPPEGLSHDRRRDSDGTSSGGETNIKPLMSLLDAPVGSPPVQGVENRGRKRSMEHEYDRPPKRMSSGDNRERPR